MWGESQDYKYTKEEGIKGSKILSFWTTDLEDIDF